MVITAGVTGAIWGITAEVGLIAQTFGAKVTREQKAEKNEQGEDCLKAWFNPLQKFNIAGVLIGSTGWGLASPGTLIAIANALTSHGVTTGGVYVDDVDVARSNTEFNKLTATATQAPLIA